MHPSTYEAVVCSTRRVLLPCLSLPMLDLMASLGKISYPSRFLVLSQQIPELPWNNASSRNKLLLRCHVPVSMEVPWLQPGFRRLQLLPLALIIKP
jgi:hypothetical protein